MRTTFAANLLYSSLIVDRSNNVSANDVAGAV
jgi:hypothetical protein